MDKPASLFIPETQLSHDKGWTVFQISFQQVTTCIVIYLINSMEIKVLNQTSHYFILLVAKSVESVLV